MNNPTPEQIKEAIEQTRAVINLDCNPVAWTRSHIVTIAAQLYLNSQSHVAVAEGETVSIEEVRSALLNLPDNSSNDYYNTALRAAKAFISLSQQLQIAQADAAVMRKALEVIQDNNTNRSSAFLAAVNALNETSSGKELLQLIRDLMVVSDEAKAIAKRLGFE